MERFVLSPMLLCSAQQLALQRKQAAVAHSSAAQTVSYHSFNVHPEGIRYCVRERRLREFLQSWRDANCPAFSST